MYAGSGNAILSNSIFGNVLGGISVSIGANDNIAPPIISSAVDAGTQTLVSGTASLGTPTAEVTLFLQFFANGTCEHPPLGEGETFLGTFTAVTGGAGTATFSVALPGGLLGKVVTATTTSTVAGPGGNTSQFSACATVVGP